MLCISAEAKQAADLSSSAGTPAKVSEASIVSRVAPIDSLRATSMAPRG